MSPGLRKLALTAHVSASVGWLGAVGSFLALAVTGLTSMNARMVSAAYVAMELTTWFVIVPLSFASLVTGLIQSLGTTWGLFRHYWVVAKLLLNVVATVILLAHTQPIGDVAAAAADTTLSRTDLGAVRVRLVADAGAALLALLVATMLSVYKPAGVTPFGERKQDVQREVPRWIYAAGILMIMLVLLFALLHLTGGGLGHH